MPGKVSDSRRGRLVTDPGSPLSDEHLVGRCLTGDERAWSAIVRRHAPLLFGMARRSVRRSEEAEDLVQDVFLKVSRMLDRFDSRSPFKPWLLQVARNHFIDHHRSHRREKASTSELDAMPYEPASTAPSQAADLLRKQKQDAVRSAVAKLPPKLREAVLLRDVEGLEYEAIAAMTGQPLGTVKSRINRGRLQLAESLQHIAEELS